MKTIIRGLLLITLVTAASAALFAAPPYAFERTYFTDASHTTICGYYNQYCWGANWGGCVTAYYEDEYFMSCGGGGGPEEPDECSDGFDNDGDGYVDQSDSDCAWGGTED